MQGLRKTVGNISHNNRSPRLNTGNFRTGTKHAIVSNTFKNPFKLPRPQKYSESKVLSTHAWSCLGGWKCNTLLFPIVKPIRCTNFSILFWNENLHVSVSSSVHHQDLFTVHTAMVCVIQVCWQLASRIRMEMSSILILLANCPQTGMTYSTAVCTVKYSWWWAEELSETCRVSFQE